MAAAYKSFCEENLEKFVNQNGIHQDSDWKCVKESGAIKVYKRTTAESNGHKAYKAEMILNHKPEHVALLCDVRSEFRKDWDLYLDDILLLETVSENILLVNHQTKPALKGIVSARDSIDMCYCGDYKDSSGASLFVAFAISVDDSRYPPGGSKYVRTKVYGSGFLVYPVEGDPSKTRFVLVFNADLNINAIGAFMADWVKPTLMIDMCGYLQEGLKKTPPP